MGEACLSRHVEEQKATLADLVARINICPDASETEGKQSPSMIQSTFADLDVCTV